MSIQYMLACAYMYVCVSLCIYMHVWACVHVCKSVCMFVSIFLCVCVCACVCVCVCVCVYVFKYIIPLSSQSGASQQLDVPNVGLTLLQKMNDSKCNSQTPACVRVSFSLS